MHWIHVPTLPARAILEPGFVVIGLLFTAAFNVVRRRRFSLAIAGVAVFIALLTVGAIYPRSQIFGSVFWRGDNRVPLVALTFDDGPNPRYTPQILDVLRAHHAAATFFVVGKNVERYPEVVLRAAKEGHVIGNHSYSHTALTFRRAESVGEEIGQTEALVIAATGRPPTLFRPPYGFRNPMVLRTAHGLGYRVVTWSVTASDWKSIGAAAIARQVLDNLRPGSIVLFHDGDGDRSQTVASLPIILEELERRGFQTATVPELLAAHVNGARHLSSLAATPALAP